MGQQLPWQYFRWAGKLLLQPNRQLSLSFLSVGSVVIAIVFFFFLIFQYYFIVTKLIKTYIAS